MQTFTRKHDATGTEYELCLSEDGTWRFRFIECGIVSVVGHARSSWVLAAVDAWNYFDEAFNIQRDENGEAI